MFILPLAAVCISLSVCHISNYLINLKGQLNMLTFWANSIIDGHHNDWRHKTAYLNQLYCFLCECFEIIHFFPYNFDTEFILQPLCYLIKKFSSFMIFHRYFSLNFLRYLAFLANLKPLKIKGAQFNIHKPL